MKFVLGAIAYFGAVMALFFWLFFTGQQKIHDSGAAAFRAGVPANANPWSGRDPMSASIWLNGWIAESNSRKGN